MTANTIIVLDPTVEAQIAQREPKPLPSDLNGKVIGFLNNDGNGQFLRIDALYKEVLNILKQRYQVKDVVWGKKFHNKNNQGASEDTLNNLVQRCDLIVNGIGV